MNPAISLQEENKKALMYTGIICGVLIVLLFLIRWNLTAPAQTVIQDRIEIDLGNEQNGWGDDPPMVKGKPTPESNPDPSSQSGGTATAATDDLSNDPDAATQIRSNKTNKPNENVGESEQTNRRPKLTYSGKNTGPNGNNDETDNGFTSQGKTPGAIGDEGSTNGKPRVIAVTRNMLKNYQFEDELGSEKIYALISVSPNGIGRFIKLEKKSTSFDVKYKNAIINCLPKIDFEGGSKEEQFTVIFDFRVN